MNSIMESDGLTIGIIAALILMSAYFSATETAFSSLNRIRIKNMAQSGNRRAQLVMSLEQNYDKLLSTILVGNNIVNIASASLATVFFVRHFGNVGATLSTIVITIVVLIFGEISPKSLAKESPERFAMLSAPIIRALMFILTPINAVFSAWKKLLSKLFKSKEDRSITEEELLTFVNEAEHEGAIEQRDSELIRNAIDFNDTRADDILTPRVDIVGLPQEATRQQALELFAETGYSRLVVFDGSLDHIVGVIHYRDFITHTYDGDNFIQSILKPAIFVAPSANISDLLRTLQRSKMHIAIVVDEYGGTTGIVTMEDILEELVGDIWDEHDEIIQQITQIGKNTYRVACNTDLDRFFEFFKLKEDEQTESSTLNGWIMEQMGKIPQAGDSFTHENLVIRVAKTEGRRVQDAVVTVLE